MFNAMFSRLLNLSRHGIILLIKCLKPLQSSQINVCNKQCVVYLFDAHTMYILVIKIENSVN